MKTEEILRAVLIDKYKLDEELFIPIPNGGYTYDDHVSIPKEITIENLIEFSKLDIKVINGSLDLGDHTELKSLEGCSDTICSRLIISNTGLTSLKHCPSIVLCIGDCKTQIIAKNCEMLEDVSDIIAEGLFELDIRYCPKLRFKRKNIEVMLEDMEKKGIIYNHIILTGED